MNPPKPLILSLRSLNPTGRKSRQVLPKISRAFPRDFFPTDEICPFDKDYDFEISMKFTSHSPMDEIESFIEEFQNFIHVRNVSPGTIETSSFEPKILPIPPARRTPKEIPASNSHRVLRNMNNTILPSTILEDDFDDKQMTFGDENHHKRNSSVNLENFRLKPVPIYVDDNKENISPEKANGKNANSVMISIDVENQFNATPAFRSYMETKTMKRPSLSLKTIMPKPLKLPPKIPTKERNSNAQARMAVKRGINLSGIEIIKKPRLSDSTDLIGKQDHKRSFLPSISKDALKDFRK